MSGHHFIPRSILEGFTNGDDKCHVINTEDGHYFQSGVAGIGLENNFFKVGDDKEYVESRIAIIDGKISALLKKIKGGTDITIDPDDMSTLISLVARIAGYNPYIRSKIYEIFKIDTFKSKFPEHEKFADHGLPFILETSIIDQVLLKILSRLDYAIFTLKDEEPGFICSDAPCSMMATYLRSRFRKNVVTNFNAGINLVFPLSSRICLFGTSFPDEFKVENNFMWNQSYVNSRVLYSSSRQIYFPSLECEINNGISNIKLKRMLGRSLKNIKKQWYNTYHVNDKRLVRNMGREALENMDVSINADEVIDEMKTLSGIL